jgi:hypothetical protein
MSIFARPYQKKIPPKIVYYYICDLCSIKGRHESVMKSYGLGEKREREYYLGGSDACHVSHRQRHNSVKGIRGVCVCYQFVFSTSKPSVYILVIFLGDARYLDWGETFS